MICADLGTARVIKAAAPSRLHAAGLASTSLVSDADAQTCLTREDTQSTQTARGDSSSRGGRALARDDDRGRRALARDDDRRRPWNRRDFIPADDPGWARCTVKSHEDFPRHIFRLFLLLGIQFRWLIKRGTLASALVTSAELAIDDAKERDWMDTYERDRNTLEDVLYRRLQELWAPFTDALKVFQSNVASQPLCAQKGFS